MSETVRETAEAILGLPAESSVFSDGWENYIDTEDLKALARAYLDIRRAASEYYLYAGCADARCAGDNQRWRDGLREAANLTEDGHETD